MGIIYTLRSRIDADKIVVGRLSPLADSVCYLDVGLAQLQHGVFFTRVLSQALDAICDTLTVPTNNKIGTILSNHQIAPPQCATGCSLAAQPTREGVCATGHASAVPVPSSSSPSCG